MNVYLAGPMRGLDATIVKEQFTQGALKLRRRGHTVFSPYDHDIANGFEYAGTVTAEQAFVRSALAADTYWICHHAEAIALLPGWGASLGATAEKALGEAIGIEIWEPMDWFMTEPSVDGAEMSRHLELRNQCWSTETRSYRQ